MLSHLTSFLGDIKSLVIRDSSDSAICIRAWALRRSTKMKSKLVAKGFVEGLGSRANSGSRRGACERSIQTLSPYIRDDVSDLMVNAAVVRGDIASV